jgi:hypothetical protein
MKTKGLVEIRDNVLWAKHIHGDNALSDKIVDLKESDTISLEIDGIKGVWVKMKDGKDGRPTPGIKAIGTAKAFWTGIQRKRGEIVSICESA